MSYMGTVVHEAEFSEPFDFLFDDKYEYKGAYGGRGSAKSHSFAAAAVIAATRGEEKFLCAREIQNSIADSCKATIEGKIRSMRFSDMFKVTDQNIVCLRTGSEFLFRGLRSNAQSITSLEGVTKTWVEEAQSVSARSLDLLMPTVFRMPNSQLWATWNPTSPDDPFDDLFRKAPLRDRLIARRVSWRDNPWFPEGLRRQMEYHHKRDRDKWEHIWEGEYQKHSQARVFRNWTTDSFEAPADAEFVYGADWGFSVDPTVLIRAYPVGNTLYIDQEAWQIGCQIERTPALFDSICNRHARAWTIRSDSARPETIDYMKRNGYPQIIGAVKGPGSVEDGIEFIKNYDLVVHIRCQHVIDELKAYSYKIHPKTQEVMPILADKHNHTIDALRYAVEALRRASYNLDNVG